MSSMASQSSASRVFTHPFVQTQIKETSKLGVSGPLWGELTGDRWPQKIIPFDDVVINTKDGGSCVDIMKYLHVNLKSVSGTHTCLVLSRSFGWLPTYMLDIDVLSRRKYDWPRISCQMMLWYSHSRIYLVVSMSQFLLSFPAIFLIHRPHSWFTVKRLHAVCAKSMILYYHNSCQ